MNILEEINDENLSKIKCLGYFLGSFDPIHNGHIRVVDLILKNNFCDSVMVYCVNGTGTYKNRSDFIERTDACASTFANRKNVIISYLKPYQIQKKCTIINGELAKIKYKNLKITSIIGSDIALGLEIKSEDKKLEKTRILRQFDYMRGHVVIDDKNYDSSVCATFLPATDIIVALRNNHQINDIPKTICGINVRAIIDTQDQRYIASSFIK